MAGQIAVVETLLKGGAIADATRPGGLHLADPCRRAGRRRHRRHSAEAQRQAERADPSGRHGADGGGAARLCRDRARCCSPRRPIPTCRTSPAARRSPTPARPSAATHRGHAAQGRRTTSDVRRRPGSAARPRRSGSRARSRSIRPRSRRASCAPAGPGGQHVNTTSTAVQLRFDVRHSPSLPDDVRQRLERLAGRRLTRDGVLVLLAQGERSQKRNREEALARLVGADPHRRPSADAAQDDQAAQGQQAPPARRQEASRRHQVAAGKTVARLIILGTSALGPLSELVLVGALPGRCRKPERGDPWQTYARRPTVSAK